MKTHSQGILSASMKALLLVLVFTLGLSALPAQSLPVVKPSGVPMYQPDLPFETLDAQSTNGVLNAELFPGVDIGAKINSAFASCFSQSCIVKLPAGKRYAFSTRFVIPGNVQYAALDCQGSALVWQGAGDAAWVAQRNDADPTGAITRCRFERDQSNAGSLYAVHQFSRAYFAYYDDTFWGFGQNANAGGILMDNNAGSGWPGYSERTRFVGDSFTLDANGIRFLGSNGGTNSFARQYLEVTCDAFSTDICVNVTGNGTAQTADLYDSYIDLRANLGDSARAISTTAGGEIRTGTVHLGAEGPSTSAGVYIDASGSSIQGDGYISLGGSHVTNLGTSDAFQVPMMSTDFTLQPLPFETGVQQSRNSKLLWNAGILRYGLASNAGVENDHGYFQVFGRNTSTADPEVDAEPSSGNMQYNVAYCSVLHGCGFGAGYGQSATRGGTIQPTHTLEFNGTMGNQQSTFGVDALGNVTSVPIKATTGTRYVCVDTSGKFVSQAAPCSGT